LAHRQEQAVDPDHRLVAAERERRWEVALRALAAARAAAEQFSRAPRAPPLDPVLRVPLRDLSTHLPTLWTSGRLTPAHQKALLRRRIRRVVLTRPPPDTVAAMVVWVSGAMTPLTVHPPVHRSADIADYDQLVARIGELSAAGYHDRAIAQPLTAQGFRSARHPHVPTTRVTHIRRPQGYASLTSQFRGQEQIAGQWTIWGLSRALQVDRTWLDARIHAGLLPATRHPVMGHYLIPDDPALLERLRAQRPPRRQR
jgi:hypothetical protein